MVPENILSLHVIDGKLVAEVQSKKIKVACGQVLALKEKIPYTITAAKKTIILLTIVE